MVFSCSLLHEATPVTRGCRFGLGCRPVELPAELGTPAVTAFIFSVGVQVETDRELSVSGVRRGVVAVATKPTSIADIVAANTWHLDLYDA